MARPRIDKIPSTEARRIRLSADVDARSSRLRASSYTSSDKDTGTITPGANVITGGNEEASAGNLHVN